MLCKAKPLHPGTMKARPGLTDVILGLDCLCLRALHIYKQSGHLPGSTQKDTFCTFNAPDVNPDQKRLDIFLLNGQQQAAKSF
jgi:hypothetical protein